MTGSGSAHGPSAASSPWRNDERHTPRIDRDPCFARTSADAALVDETLGTVSGQSCHDHEAILVDDGSPFDLASVGRRHARTTVVRRPNGGAALARNTGIAASRGQFFVFLDADDHLLPGRRAARVSPLVALRAE